MGAWIFCRQFRRLGCFGMILAFWHRSLSVCKTYLRGIFHIPCSCTAVFSSTCTSAHRLLLSLDCCFVFGGIQLTEKNNLSALQHYYPEQGSTSSSALACQSEHPAQIPAPKKNRRSFLSTSNAFYIDGASGVEASVLPFQTSGHM